MQNWEEQEHNSTTTILKKKLQKEIKTYELVTVGEKNKVRTESISNFP